MSEVQPKEIWILKTPGCEFVEHDEPMNYDWRNCRKTKFVEYSAHDSLKKENEELKDRIGKLRKALQKYADPETWKNVCEYGVDTWIIRDDQGNLAREYFKEKGKV